MVPRLRARATVAAVTLAAVGALAPVARAAPVNWHRCASADARGFQCATVRAPLDHRKPAGPHIDLSVIRHRATDRAHRIGTLFYNPGGPAASTPILPVALGVLPHQWRERFDIVTWDLRGLGDSTAVRCFRSQDAEDQFLAGVGKPALSFPVGPTQTATWISRWRAFGARCERRSGVLLRHVSTADSARDLDLLRRATGERRLSFFGTSYGTFLGATYANLFPGRVRAMALASAIDPARWTSPASGAPTYVRQDTDEGAARTLDAFLDLCGSTDVAHCAFSAGSPQATRAKYAELLGRLPRERPSSELTYASLTGLVVNGLYVSPRWGELAALLQNAWTAGSIGEPVDDQFPGIGGTLAINCSDSPNPGPAGFPPAAAAADQRSGAVGSLWTWATGPCATWPASAADRYAGPWNRRTANPVLVIGNTFDPSTPYSAAVALSRELGRARLLTVDGYGHGSPSACTSRRLTAYLIHGTLPPRGTRCAGEAPFSS